MDAPIPADNLDFESIFQDFIDANAKTWAHDRGESVGASEAFDCIRKVWFRKLGEKFGFEQDADFEQSWGATKRGDILEVNFVVPAVRDHLPGNAKLLLAGNQQKTFFHKFNSATPDGVIVGLKSDALKKYGIDDIGSDCVMLEIKSIDPRVGLHEEKAIHRGQTQVQMGIMREETRFRPNFAVIIYVDASFLDKIKVFVVPFDQATWVAAQDRASLVFQTTDPAELTPEGKIDDGCGFCPFQSACASVTIGAMPEDNSKKVDDHFREELQPILDEYRRMHTDARTCAKDFELQKQVLKEKLAELGSRKASLKDHWNVTWYSQKGSKSLNRGAVMEALGIESLDDFMKEGDPFDVLRVTFND